jgi:hypothetical protein
MELRRISLAVAGTAVAYFALSRLNHYVFLALSISPDGDWLFLPSGVCLFAVLLFVHWGALGVVLGSFAFALCEPGLDLEPATRAVSMCLSGLAPLVARQICIGVNKLKADLAGLSSTDLVYTTLAFSAVNAALQQSWLAMRGQAPDFLASLLAMFTGYAVGTLMVLYFTKMLFSIGARLRRG